MATTKLITQHDYMTLRVNYSKETRIVLTTARYREKMTATVDIDGAVLRRVLPAFAKSRNLVGPKFKTIGEWIARVKELAEAASTPADFVASLEAMS